MRFASFLPGLLEPDPEADAKTFVLWEPCSQSHGEIVPGYARHLLDLGYKVLIFLTPERIAEGLFERISEPRITVSRLPQWRIRRWMHAGKAAKAAGVMITTAGKLPKTRDGLPDLARVFGGAPARHVLMVEHDARALVDSRQWDPTFITLRAVNLPGVASVVVNPHWFGEVAFRPKNQKTVFLMAGAAQSKRRAQSLVYDAAERLLAAGITGFELRLVGKKDRQQPPEALRAHVRRLGRVSFSTLYRQVEECDFIVTAFQRDNPNHAFYRTTGTTGAFQLSYGFRKPCLVQKDFIASSAFDQKNALLYDSDAEMFDAMRNAIDMTGENYAAMQHTLTASVEKLRTQSLQNLRALLNE